jgi:putative transcriptional regulator
VPLASPKSPVTDRRSAEIVGVSRQTINSIEKGRYVPSLALGLGLARYVDGSVEEMFDANGGSSISEVASRRGVASLVLGRS